MSLRYAVRMRGLRKSYPLGKQRIEVLHGIDLDIPEGSFVSIMGPSGSGKSTLLNMIGLLDEPTDGRLAVAGQDVSRLKPGGRAMARRQHLGFVFQSFNLMARMDAMRNVMLPMAIAGVPRGERRSRARALLDDVGLADRLHHKPSELSGGQRQRVAIARALALDPSIILADEPTGNLDSRTSTEIMALFQDLHRRGRTIIQVTHSTDMARYGERTIELRDGIVRRDPGRHFAAEGMRMPRPVQAHPSAQGPPRRRRRQGNPATEPRLAASTAAGPERRDPPWDPEAGQRSRDRPGGGT